jgi:hypothetical protein
MGWRFDLKHINAVAYITVPGQTEPPRFTRWQLHEFLGSIQGEYRDRPPLISFDQLWINDVTHAARSASEHLRSQVIHDEDFLNRELVAESLSDLRVLLGHFELFGMPIGTEEDSAELTAFAQHAAYSSRQHALFLIPDFSGPYDTLEIFDPLPIASAVAKRPDLWPGMLFWIRSGYSAFAALSEAPRLYQLMLDGFRDGLGKVEEIIDDFNKMRRESPNKRLLQLSDLHFGTTKALENQAYLSAHLKSELASVDRIVITGDLFDNPKRADALAFRNFRADLETATGKDAIVIPGNHDQKILGNTVFGFGRKLKQLANLEWSSLVIDDDLQCVFYCFDSSKDATDFATGRVSREQMMEVATLFETKAALKPELRMYLSIALIHHHPYSFKSKSETRIQKFLALIGLNDERFLRMDDAEQFLSWCVGRNIPLIMHGHKHVPRHVTDRIEWTHGKEHVWRNITAVGCGTSLGIENLPLSYNILEWSPSAKKWSASFFSDPGFGTGFEEQYVALHAAGA